VERKPVKIEIEDMCDGIFVVYQEDENGVVNSVVLSSGNVVSLLIRAYPDVVESLKKAFDSYGREEDAVTSNKMEEELKVRLGSHLRLVESLSAKEAA
jgi:hypothetical protein